MSCPSAVPPSASSVAWVAISGRRACDPIRLAKARCPLPLNMRVPLHVRNSSVAARDEEPPVVSAAGTAICGSRADTLSTTSPWCGGRFMWRPEVVCVKFSKWSWLGCGDSLRSLRGTSLCSIGNDHPFVPTCLLAERRAQRQSRMPPRMRRHRRSRRAASLTERARC